MKFKSSKDSKQRWKERWFLIKDLMEVSLNKHEATQLRFRTKLKSLNRSREKKIIRLKREVFLEKQSQNRSLGFRLHFQIRKTNRGLKPFLSRCPQKMLLRKNPGLRIRRPIVVWLQVRPEMTGNMMYKRFKSMQILYLSTCWGQRSSF